LQRGIRGMSERTARKLGRRQQGILAGCGLPGPPSGPAQLLLEPPRPENPDRDQAASQSRGLTNRRMRARMSGGVGGDGATPSPPRSLIFPGKTLAAIGRTGELTYDRCPGLGQREPGHRPRP
jgi:hypothetical protein